jgi:tetratricopeptide (TPR) repeat protein
MEEELYGDIERYVSNEMDATERAAFEQRVKNDGGLAEKLSIYQSVSRTLEAKYKGENDQRLFKQTLSEMEVELVDNPEARVLKLNWYTWAAAASVALLCAVLIYSSFSKPEYVEYAHFEPLALVDRGNADGLKSKAEQAFNSKDYANAVSYLNTLLSQNENDIELQLYRGISLLELSQVEEAERSFEKVRASSSIYQAQGTWMLALSALKQKDYDKCKLLLSQIPKESPVYTDAKRLLEDL